MIATDRES